MTICNPTTFRRAFGVLRIFLFVSSQDTKNPNQFGKTIEGRKFIAETLLSVN